MVKAPQPPQQQPPQESVAMLQQAPVIVSEVRLNFDEQLAMNRNIVNTVLELDVDLISKVGLLNRILPGSPQRATAPAAGSCSCSCSCTCGAEAQIRSLAPQSGRV